MIDQDTIIRNLSLFSSVSAPSSAETEILHLFRTEVSQYVDLVKTDPLGNIYAYKKGCSNKTIMFVAHCDEIGLMIKYIDDRGYIYASPIGGIDPYVLIGQKVKILHKNAPVIGIVGMHPIHIQSAKNETKKEISDLWIDIGAKSKEDALKKVAIGDYITFVPSFEIFPNNNIVCKSADNRSGIVILLGILQAICQESLETNVIVVVSVQEEIGLRGAKIIGNNMNADYCIAIDVTNATDIPNVSHMKYGEITVGGGVAIAIGPNFNQNLQNQIINLAVLNKIKYQIECIPYNSGTDINAIQIANKGYVTSLISIPCRYMHTPVELISLEDIISAITLSEKICKIL